MKKLLFILILLPLLSGAQTNLDSLWSVWNDPAQPDTSRLKAMYKIARHGYLFSQPDSAFYFAQLQYDLAEQKNEKKHMANALNTQGVSFAIRGNHTKAINYYTRCLKIYEEIGNKKGMGNTFNNIGMNYMEQGEYAKAIDYYTKSLKIDKELGDKKSMATSFNNIGIIYYHQVEYAKANDYFTKSLQIDEEIGDKQGMAHSLNDIGNVYYEQGNYAKAIEYYTKSLNIKEEIGDKNGMADSFNNIGLIYYEQGDYAKAIDYFTNSLKIKEEMGDKKGMSTSFNNIGAIYLNQGEYAKAIDYHTKGLKIKEEIGDKNGMAMFLNNIGAIYHEKGNYAKAIDYYTNSLNIKEEIGGKKGIADSFNNIGNVYMKQGEYTKAMDYYTKSLKIAEEIGNKNSMAASLNNIGNIYYDQGNYAKAKEYNLHALNIAQEVGVALQIKGASKSLWKAHSKLGNYKESLAMYELHIATRDSINSEENQKEVIRQEFKYNYEKKEAIANTKHAAAMLQQETQALAEQKQQNIIIASGTVGLGLILIFTFFVVSRLRLSRRQKKIIELQKTEVEQQKKVVEIANAQKDNMFSIIGHDLRAPISQLNMGLNMLYKKNLSDEEREEILTELERDAGHTYSLLDNLLNWAISQKGLLIYQPKIQSIEPIIKENLQLFTKEAKRKQIHLSADLSKEASAYFDQYMVNTVIRNLIANALKFTEPEGKINVSSRIIKQADSFKEEQLEISVSDTGIGISNDVLPELFKQNKHIRTFGTNNEKGSGLGLHICKEMIEKNKGKITIQNNADKGCNVRFNLPLLAINA
ncbi:MAG: hypothetical protein COB15_08230 [Flavobacteriales bacterium]|nr:MAG: hypothetical protein COB15_08230 [Flavobacteriales bacterium]